MTFQEIRQGIGRVLMVTVVMVTVSTLLLELCQPLSLTTRKKPADPRQKESPHKRRRREMAPSRPQVGTTTTDGVVTFWYNSSSVHVATYVFDLSKIVDLSEHTPGQNCWAYHNLPNRKGGPGSGDVYICVTDDYWGQDCGSWGAVGWNLGTDWGYKPEGALNRKDKNGKSLLSRMTLMKTGQCTSYSEIRDDRGSMMPLTLTIENPSPEDAGKYWMGTLMGGMTRQEPFYLKDVKDEPVHDPEDVSRPEFSSIKAIADPTYEDIIAIETGYNDVNVWLEWTRFTARQHNMTNCYVCANARPHLGTVPLHVPSKDEACVLSIFTNRTMSNDSACEIWKKRYPLKTSPIKPQLFVTVYKGNYTCYNGSDKGANVKNFPPGYCMTYSSEESESLENQTVAMGDVYWLCGDMAIRQTLPRKWRGQCALTKLIMPIHMMGERLNPTRPAETRKKRGTQGPGGSLDPHVYIDAIGVPRGVPDEFKARDQVAAGFESLLPQVTINKNVDWINYIYYNQQRFVNYTRDAIAGLAAELGPNSRMTFQNRMALDMILAEKGGVCKMIGVSDTCCTFIPNNTGPTGKVTQALEKLTSLSIELKKNSGIDKPWGSWFEGMFSSWQEALKTIGIILVCIVLILAVIACCVIPLIKRMLTKTMVRDTAYGGLQGQEMNEYDDTENPPLSFD